MNLDRTGVGHHKRKKKANSASSAGAAKEDSEKPELGSTQPMEAERLHGEDKIAVLHHRVAGGMNHGMSARRQCLWRVLEEKVEYGGRGEIIAREPVYGKKETSGASEGKNLPLLSHSGGRRNCIGQECKKHVGKSSQWAGTKHPR